MAMSTIFLALALCGGIEGLQQAFRDTPSLLTLTGPGAQYARVVSFAAPTERASVEGYGSSYYDDIQDGTSQVEATATASAKSFFVPPPPPLAATDPATQTCAFAPRFCPNSRYRSLDGSCNNRQKPTWGMPQTPYGRLTPYKYGDGISSMPRAASGRQLPNARELSFRLFVDKHLIDPFFSLITQQWGQIVTHDMSLAASRPSTGGAACCSNNGQLQSGVTTNPACAPILLPPNDPIHANEGAQCQNFLRSGTTTDFGCTPPNVPAAPLTTVTAYLDLSLVYGNSASQIAPLRARSGGRMLTLVRNGQEWPPQDPNVTTACRPARSPFEPCYLTGDVRVNQNSQLTLLQIILLREHNRIADVLAHLNPHWNDETLFQEARRIHVAQTQYITYYEYLPILLGFDNMVQNKLIYPYKHVDDYNPYVNDYNPEVDPAVLNEHATAAFRHFHTLIRGFLKLVNENRQLAGTVRLSDWLNRPLVLEIDNSFAKLARGLTSQEMDFSDQYWDSEITEFLFRGNRTFGGDLRATDIQRGRDQGLGSYVTTRAACELPIPKTFHDMLDYISHENVALLQNMYESPEDVDLVVAGSLERNVPGALAGPTFLCILTEQFYRTRVGDRYFFENGGDREIAFTPSQLEAIRNANMARLMCDNTEGIHLMQPQAFRVISHDNKLVPCNELPFVDLTLWQDARGHKK